MTDLVPRSDKKCDRCVQVGTIDALLMQLAIDHSMTLLTTDRDFKLATKHCALRLWAPKTASRRK